MQIESKCYPGVVINDDSSADEVNGGMFGIEHHQELGYDEAGECKDWANDLVKAVDEGYRKVFKTEYQDGERIIDPTLHHTSQKIAGLLWDTNDADNQHNPRAEDGCLLPTANGLKGEAFLTA